MRVNYTVKGEGPPLILLHGWGGSLKSLEQLQFSLATKGFQVFNLDLPGFGQSEVPVKVLSLQDYVEFIAKFVERLNIFKPTLIGHSFGGKIALALALTHKNLPARLILINASAIYPKNSLKKTLFLYPTKIFGALLSVPLLNLLKPFLRKVYYKYIVREQDYLKAETLRDTFKKVVNEHLDDRLGAISTETLIIWGEKDRATPLWQGESLAGKIKNSRLEIVEGATHGLPLKQPEIVAKIIKAYLNL